MVANSLTEQFSPEHRMLRRKLDAFRCDYALEGRPALVWQCAPQASMELDVKSPELQQALADGAPGGSDAVWWHSFRSGRAVPVFDGLAAASDADRSGWVSEVHGDGHIMAGLWRFPELAFEGSRLPCLSTFHADAFADFSALAANLLRVMSYEGPCRLTCTLLQAPELAFVQDPNFPRAGARGLRREELQWRVRTPAGAAEVLAAGAVMAEELLRAYGLWPR